MTNKTIGIIGCGAIGTALVEFIEKDLDKYVSGIVVWDVSMDKAEAMKEKFNDVSPASCLEDIVLKTDLIIEAAHPSLVPDLLDSVIKNKKDVMVMSIGGIIGNEDLLEKADAEGVKIMLPSGAIAGIDAIKAFGIAGIETATITTRKAPKSVKGAPYLEKNGIDADNITQETVIFEGTALEAIKGFPKNVNVSALLSIAGIGPEKTKVRLIVSPEFTKNSHEIEVTGKAGRLVTRTENVPFPENPKTSYLAALAAMASLKTYFSGVRIGT